MEQRLSLVTLGVADIERARRFYEAMGWSGESPDGEVVFFQAGGMIVALWSRVLLAADSEMDDRGGWGGVTLAHNVGSPAAVDAVLTEAERAGGTIARPGAATSWGGYSGVFVDPDGHPWEVAHNPGWVLGRDGSTRLRPESHVEHETITLVAWSGPWLDEDPDANFKRDVAVYALVDPMPTLRNLGASIDVPVGALVRYVLAKWTTGGSGGLLELGPTMARRLADVCARAEAEDTEAARLRAYAQLRDMVAWLNLPLDDPEASP